jgi:CheY-like chemotaxis protein
MEVDSDYVKNLAYCGPGLYVRITVEDDGQGIDDETIKHIFEPFFTTKPVGEGTGLGLSTVFGIVKEHSGFLDVVSKAGEGTRFSLFFPASPVLDEEAPKLDMSEFSGEGSILIVDEDRDLLEVLSRLLTNYGYSVVTETDGQRALELVSGDDEHFDAVVVNHQLPVISGREMIPLLKQSRRNLPIALMTGYGGAGTRAEGKRFGADEFLEKPILPEKLLRTVSQLVKKNRRNSGD